MLQGQMPTSLEGRASGLPIHDLSASKYYDIVFLWYWCLGFSQSGIGTFPSLLSALSRRRRSCAVLPHTISTFVVKLKSLLWGL